MKNITIVGDGYWLDVAVWAAKSYGLWNNVNAVKINKVGLYEYDMYGFSSPDKNTEYFLAIDGLSFGTVREYYMLDMMRKGYVMTSILKDGDNRFFKSRTNCLVSPGSIIYGDNSALDFNVLIGPDVKIHDGFRSGRSLTIEGSSIISNNVNLGRNVSLRQVSKVKAQVNVCPYCSFECLDELEASYSKPTILTPRFKNPVVIYNN